MLAQSCGAGAPAKRAVSQVSAEAIQGTAVVMWPSGYWVYSTVRRVAVLAGEAADVAGDHHAVALADPRLVRRRAFELAEGALADQERRVGVPPVPMISWLAAWT